VGVVGVTSWTYAEIPVPGVERAVDDDIDVGSTSRCRCARNQQVPSNSIRSRADELEDRVR
jgi:hypothetical protein